MGFKITTLLALLSATSVLAWSPTDSYAPGNVTCPSYLQDSNYNTSDYKGLIREASSLSEYESDWIEGRHEITDENLKWFLNLANMTDFDTDDFLDSLNRSLNIGLAFSGGGYRAMLNAAGQLAGLDNRTEGCYEHGLPILSSVTYIAGLSGGSWFLSTLAFNNWTSVQDIVNQNGQDDAIWDLTESIFDSDGLNIFGDIDYWHDISDDLEAKDDAGFNISLTDPWGRALSYQFFPTLDDHGASMTFSSLRNFTVFQEYNMPFPILVADGRTPGTMVISSNSTMFEITPFELGSWDPSLKAFADIKYIGTDVNNGFPINTDNKCIAGFDNTGFMFGTSSTLFNQFLLQLNTTGLSGVLYDLLEDFLGDISDDYDDIAVYNPNPFYNSEWGTSDNIVESDTLYLVDGGEDLQNIPLAPLLQTYRDVDVIFAFDNSYDTDETWPNGTSMVYTYQRQFTTQGEGTAFPYVPDQTTFLNLNLTARPAFFGCYADNMTDLMEEVNTDHVPPLVVYMANRPFSYYTNTSTYQMSYSDEEKLGIIQNGFEVSSRLNLTLDDEWRACVGCAIVQRERERLGLDMGEQCQRCFDTYCWDGSLDTDVETVPVNFTETGMTNGDEDTNNTSGAFGLSQTIPAPVSFINQYWNLFVVGLAIYIFTN